ncbi:unnamed protein product [Rhizoctonia solani]|uniref:High-affinity methionine permease n=1 Tax=Rhizoctonia solani TaxID=456999 RepID=A0A8H3HX98_9AGAM|nr:unnamed protein product [Rhizoctonia solani]
MQRPLEPNDSDFCEDVEEASQALTSLAPIEETSPLGYNVNFINATLLNTSAMIGMGIFSTPSFVLRSVGSVGMLITLYLFVPLITTAGLMVYIELTSMCGQKRSGAEVVYLEEAYPKPRFLLSTIYALITGLLSYAGVISTIFAKHVLHGFGTEVTPLRQRSIAIAMCTAAIWGMYFLSIFLPATDIALYTTFFNIGCLTLISLTGLACLFGWTSVPNSGSLRHPFDGTLFEANAFATSIVKVHYSFVGWNTILGLMAEVKGRRPVRTIQRAGITSLLITAFLFLTTLLSFSVVLTKDELLDANEVLGTIFLRKVYGDTTATKLFPILVGISAFGGIVSGTLHYGRMLREAGRQGVLPFATFWSRIGRFKTPYGPVLLKWVLAIFLIIAAPAQDTVVFLIDLASYPALVFSLLIGCGVWILRHRRQQLGLPEHAYRAPDSAIFVYVLQSIALLIMPWIPPKDGSKGGDVGFFYATYCIVAIMLLLLCGLYYWVRIYALPQLRGYELVEETISLPGGVKTMVLKKIYKERGSISEAKVLTSYYLCSYKCVVGPFWLFAQHILHGYDIAITPLRQRSIAIAILTVAIGVCLFSNKWALRVNSVAAFFKIGCLVLISATGLACLFGWTPVPNSGNLRYPFRGTLYEAGPLATSIVQALYGFVGWNSILGLMGEVQGRRPVRTVKRAGIASILITACLFITTLLSFSIVLTKEELINANEVLGVVFLRKVYGDIVATRLFPIFIGINTFGAIVSTSLYYGRMLREAGRQGMLPFATFWSRIGRFKTPYGPVLLKWVLSISLIAITPAQDTVAFLIDLASYPTLVFSLLIGCGVWILRRQRQKLGLPEHAYKAPNYVVFVYVLQSIILLIMPWIPPKGGSKGGDVSFFYATYCIVTVLLFLLCGLYYWIRFCALPQLLGYDLVGETVSLPGGVKTIILKKVYKTRMEGEEEPLLRGAREN